MTTTLANERIERSILVIRSQRVMLDTDLAVLYEVPVKVLNQAVKRNGSRFPQDFMFQLTAEESDSLRSRFVTLKEKPWSAPKISPVCIHRTRGCDAFQCASQQKGNTGEY
jgi:hypothetical protein